jgi:YD repeat-containing protein
LIETENNVQTKRYTYKNNGNSDQIATLTAGGRTLDYQYDDLGRLWCITTTAGSINDCGPSSGAAPSPSLVQDYEYDYNLVQDYEYDYNLVQDYEYDYLDWLRSYGRSARAV